MSYEPTPHIRWYRPKMTLAQLNAQLHDGQPVIAPEDWDDFIEEYPEFVYAIGFLQQLWRDPEAGDEEWRTIPEVVEP